MRARLIAVRMLVLNVPPPRLGMMYHSVDMTEIDLQPVRDFNKFYCIFFVLFIIVGSFFVMNLFVGVTIDKFNEAWGVLRTTTPQPFHNRTTTVPQPYHNRSATVSQSQCRTEHDLHSEGMLTPTH